MDSVEVKIQLDPGVQPPEYQTPGAAGLDLRARYAIQLAPGERKLVPTGLRLVIPEGFEGQVRPRSGLALRLGLGMVNSPGTIDSDYRGEVGVLLINFSTDIVEIEEGDRIAQLVICPIARANLTVVASVAEDATVRGEDGFGSTGKQ